MALAPNTITTQSSTVAHAPAAKTHDKPSTDETSSFDDVLAQQDGSVKAPNARASAQGNFKTKAPKSARRPNKSNNMSDDKVDTDAAATVGASRGTKAARAGKAANKAKDSVKDTSEAEAANDNEHGIGTDLTQPMPPVPPPTTQSASPPSAGGGDSTLEAISDAANGAQPATIGASDTDAGEGADEMQAADGTATSGKAQSPSAFQKILSATKGAATKDSQAAKAAPDKDAKTADANVEVTSTDTPPDVKSAAPANTDGTSTAPTAAPVGNTAAPASNEPAAVTASGPATPDLHGLAVEIAAKSLSGAKQFDIRLDPPELGRVDVRLSIDVTGKAQAHLSADRPQTLELLQKDAPTLTRALRDAGLDVSQGALNFSLKNQQHKPGGDNSGSQSSYDGAATSSANIVLETNTRGSAYSSGAGLLDIKI